MSWQKLVLLNYTLMLTRPLGLSNPSPAQMQALNRLTVCAVGQQNDCGCSALFSI